MSHSILRNLASWASKRKPVLKLVDRLGRGRGRLRFLDDLRSPPPAPLRPNLSRWHDHTLAAAWLGHASVLLRFGGMTILTDPVMCNRVGVGLGLLTVGPHRRVAPALAIRELPAIDLILISHAHYDHLDRPTLARLNKSIPVVTAGGTFDLIHDLGYRRITELRWGQSTQMADLRITAHRVKHWGARSLFDTHRGYNAYLLECGGRRVLYGGDSAYGEHFREIGKTDLAILGIGGYDPYIHAHANPEQVWEMAEHASADFILPMHHSTFRLSHEPVGEPMMRFLQAAGREAPRIIVRQVGGMWQLPA